MFAPACKPAGTLTTIFPSLSNVGTSQTVSPNLTSISLALFPKSVPLITTSAFTYPSVLEIPVTIGLGNIV